MGSKISISPNFALNTTRAQKLLSVKVKPVLYFTSVFSNTETMALPNANLDARDIEVAELLLQLQGNFQRPLQLMINQNPAELKPLTNKGNNMNVVRVTSRPGATSTPTGSENIPMHNGYKKNAMSDNPALSTLPPKKRLNIYQKHMMAQRRWAQEKAFLEESSLFEPKKVQMKDAATQTEGEYISPTKNEELKALHAELKDLREQVKKNDSTSVRTPSESSGEEVRRVPVRERESTSSNETQRVLYKRNAKENNIFCNGSRKAQIKEDSVSDNDSDYKAETDEDHQDLEEEVEVEESDETEMPVESIPQMNGKEAMVSIGLGNARVPSRVLKNVDWNGSYTTVTRKLLTAVFPRSVLATHSLTGKQSPAFPNKAAKRKLDPLLVEDIVRTVSDKCKVKEAQVRTSITTKCADESKMLRNRQQNKKKYRKESTCSS